MNDELNHLRKRVQELEAIAHEYARLQHLIDDAAQGQDLARHMALSGLYVDPETRLITEANNAALELLGYSRSALLAMTIDDLELAAQETTSTAPDHDVIEARIYSAIYRHQNGYPLTLMVSIHSVAREERRLLFYRLTDHSLHRRLSTELQRRDDGFRFQQKLTTLNEITLELSRAESFDGLCQQAVRLGAERLDFDRIGLWLVDTEHGLMRGTYGVDENGNVRAEHDKSWSYIGRQIDQFIQGRTSAPLVLDDAPLYNDQSEIIRYGWVITVPLMQGQHCIGTLVADNFRRNQPIRNYEPELLRLYGITIAHLMELSHSREQAVALRGAEELSHMLREFIANIGHDFRTPLSIIKSNAYLIQRQRDSERQHLLAGDIQHQAQLLGDMANRALEFIALQRAADLKRTRVYIAGLLETIIHQNQSDIQSRGIHLDVVLDREQTMIADSVHLSRALHEIIRNAILYNVPNGWVRVQCIVYTAEIGLRIQDGGIGMDKEMLKRIFDPLYRGDQARSEQRSGLGLTIARAIVEAHGGRILVASLPGKGSTFEVILPQE